MFSRQDMFSRVDAIMQKQDKDVGPQLDAESLYYLQKLHRRFHQNGCGIADEGQRSEFKAKMKRLGDLVRECNKRLNEDKSGLWLDLDELEGIPQSLIGRLTQGEGEHSDQLWLPTKVPFTSPAITSAKSEATRKRIYYAVHNRMEMNVPLFREILLLRDDTARMLGYADHASFKTADKMMQNPQAVEALLSEIRQATAPLAAQDVEELLEIKRDEAKSRGANADELYFWDLSYYSARRSEKQVHQDASTSEYFELNTSLAKLLEMFEHLFGAQFRRIDVRGLGDVGRSLVWHEDVQMYSVWNVDGPEEFLGYAYLDLFPRDGKNSHSGHYSLQQVSLSPLSTPLAEYVWTNSNVGIRYDGWESVLCLLDIGDELRPPDGHSPDFAESDRSAKIVSRTRTSPTCPVYADQVRGFTSRRPRFRRSTEHDAGAVLLDGAAYQGCLFSLLPH